MPVCASRSLTLNFSWWKPAKRLMSIIVLIWRGTWRWRRLEMRSVCVCHTVWANLHWFSFYLSWPLHLLAFPFLFTFWSEHLNSWLAEHLPMSHCFLFRSTSFFLLLRFSWVFCFTRILSKPSKIWTLYFLSKQSHTWIVSYQECYSGTYTV